jgi:putative alpha-1,2-mannosidase
MKAFMAAVLIVGFACLIITAQRREFYPRFVNPLIGTQKMGHTFPGATVPFGSVQLSPDTDEQPHNINGVYNKDTYKYCAGYQYDDREIVGFSHTHFSGTGHSDLGDFLIMPTTENFSLSQERRARPARVSVPHFRILMKLRSPAITK